MIIPQKFRLKNTIKYPTTIIIGGINKLGLEIADSLMEQGGYVIIIDTVNDENLEAMKVFPEGSMISFLDYTSILHIEEDIRRLDYVFYFAHDSEDFKSQLSTQEFLTFSNYLDAILSLASKFEAKFLLTTSIKAHQMLYSDNDPLLSLRADRNSHTTYTDMEMQRYAEGLTLEYAEKIGLDIRITRLGEIIGDAIDITKSSAFVDLILNAVKGESLMLRNDGLESEWYVHVLDCSYGLIKAMFTKNTNGQIYSVAYENTFTQIAIAYKIQELEENAKEIQFMGGGHPLPPLKIHKPAPNLSKIGWLPRVSFEKAVVQSLAAAKILLMELQSPELNLNSSLKSSSMLGKLKSFMNLAQTNSIDSLKTLNKDSLRKNRINIAAESLNKKKRARPKSLKEKVQDFFWGIFTSIASIFTIFKNKSPLEAAVLIFGIIFGVFIYLVFFSPLIILLKNGFILFPEKAKVKGYIETMQFEKLEESSEKINNSLVNIENTLDKFEGVFKFITLEEEYNSTIELLNSYELYSDGLRDISKTLVPFSEYTKSFENNTQIRTGTDSYLSLANPGIDYDKYLSKMEQNEPYLELGILKIESANEKLKNINISNFPFFTKQVIKKENEKLINSQIINYADSLQYIPEILGNHEKKTYLVIGLDNTRQTPLGGELSTFALLTLQKGGITEITLQSFDDVDFNLKSINQEDLNQINNRRFNVKSNSNVRIEDLASVNSLVSFKGIISDVFEDTFNRSVDGVVTLNLEAYENIIKNLSSSNEIQVNNIDFTGNNFLENLNSTQSSNANLEVKKTVISQLLAMIVNESLKNLNNDFGNIYQSFAQSLENSNILLDIDNFDYAEFINKNNYNSEKIYNTESYAIVGINVLDSNAVNIEKYPSVNLALKTEITKKFDLINTLKITFPNIGTKQEVSTCLPLNVNTNTIDVEGISSSKVVINENDENKCIVATVLSENEISVSWRITDKFDEKSNNINLELGINKVRGADTTLDYEITYDPTLNIQATNDIISNGNSIIFTKKLNSDEIVKLLISK